MTGSSNDLSQSAVLLGKEKEAWPQAQGRIPPKEKLDLIVNAAKDEVSKALARQGISYSELFPETADVPPSHLETTE